MVRSRSYLVKAALVCLLAVSSLIATAAAAFAYPPVPGAVATVSTTCTGVIPAGGSCTITILVTANGATLSGATVSFTVSVPPGGSVSPNPGVTGADGTVTVTYRAPAGGGVALAPADALLASYDGNELAAVSACSGSITATSGGVSTSIPISVACAAASSGNLLPTTSTAPPASGGGLQRLALGAAGVVGLLIAIGAAARLRRSRRLAL